MTDCANACVRYVLTAKELRMDTEAMYSTCGYYKVAGEALSSRERAQALFRNARGNHSEPVEQMRSDISDRAAVNKQQVLEALVTDLNVCGQISRQHRAEIEREVKKYLHDAQ